MRWARAWLVLCAAWSARAGPGPPDTPFAFAHPLYNLSIPENSPARTYALPPAGADPAGIRLPAAGVRVRFRIRHGDRDKFFKAEERTVGDFCFLSVRTRAGHADVLNRERRDLYRLEVRATAQLSSGGRLEADAVLAVNIADENDLSPLFYPTEYEAQVPEDAPLHASVARVTAEDADIGLNGEIYYSLAEPTDRFAVHPTTGVVTLTRSLLPAERSLYELTVLARDRASLLARGEAAPAAHATLTVHVARVNLHAPELRVRRQPDLVENTAAGVYAIVEAIDRDAGDHGRIAALDIVDGDPDGHFRVRPSAQPGEYDVLVHALLDREAAPRGYNLTLRATDAGAPPRSSYLTLPVTLVDVDDNSPVFSRETYEAAVPESAPPGTPVIRLKVSDRDEGRNARGYVEIVGGNEGAEFRLNPDTGVLYTAAPLDADLKPFYALTVSALDQGDAGARHQSSAKLKITVLDANDNDPVFENPLMEVALPENGPSGAAVARVLARDADSGDNGYVSYSVANLRPVPFEVDHFTGAVRATRLLDYETMRRQYSLRVRASDWGLPYRRQAEMRLLVRLEDINDNRPQFERVDCVGHLPRKLPLGSEIMTLSAIDFDAGDVVSYRLAAGNDDGCFALDPGTGVLATACDLAAVRADTRLLNVTATDGTHFADPATVTLHLVPGAGADGGGATECRDTGVARRLTDLLAAAERANAPLDPDDEFPPAPSRYGENLHAPEFQDFPVEIKVNESVALGTTLVRLRAADRDLGYNGLLTYAISGGDGDSAFRIDPDTGELQVIGYLDRERETEYYLNVTAYDLGRPRRAASRLLPVTVLDVNDNRPRFAKTLASFRLTENALNGTLVFRAEATDRDAGEYGRVAYSLTGADDDEFCIDRDSGALTVCAALDRERRALYELTVRATDGGGLYAEALVRVALDDVNDNAPRFPLASYAVRVREDVPRGTLVAVLDAFDPDLGASGRVTYSLPDRSDAFAVDAASGALRTAGPLDFETRQVYGVTVRATDGGQPALWTESTVIVEVVDVDENLHAPQFSEHAVVAGAVREDAPPGTVAAVAQARDADPPGRDSRLAYYLVAGSGLAHFSVDEGGAVRTLTPLDREARTHYWLTVCAQDHGLVPRHGCVRLYVEVLDVNDVAPWPERAVYSAAVPEQSAAGAPVHRVQCTDGDAAPAPRNISYSIVAGNPDGLFSVDERTGEVVTTGRALDREAAAAHALEVQCSDGELASTARLLVRLLDLNDHAPAFTQRSYEFRVPAAAAAAAAADVVPADSAPPDSAEWDEDDELLAAAGRAAWDLCSDAAPAGRYLGTVLALDPDEAANGTVRYWSRARGPARHRVRVHAATGRLYADAHLLVPPGALEVLVRACDGGPRPRCAIARVSVRATPLGGGEPPALPAPAPLQVTELDPPGYLIAVLQAFDPDADPLYYDIVDGDPRREFVVGRETGTLVLGTRLLWERQRAYRLNVSVTDGVHVAHTAVNVTVINDANEAGVRFSRDEYLAETSESRRVGETLLVVHAAVPGEGSARVLYGLRGSRAPASARLFRLHEVTGALELAHPLDRESARLHELTVFARDAAPRAAVALARVRVLVHDADEHAPVWGRRLAEARVARTAPAGALVAALRAGDADAGDAARVLYSLAGEPGPFAVDPVLGDVRLARELPARGPPDYTVHVRASNPPPAGRSSTLPLHVLIVEPDDTPPRFAAEELEFEVYENEPAGTALGAVEARAPASVWYTLSGARGLFRLDPAAGLLATAAPLDREAADTHDLLVTALAMGGGLATARVRVHVLDRNEFAPRLLRREYVGRVSEAAPPGALVRDNGTARPLVFDTDDGDSPAHRQRLFEITDPDAAALFNVDGTTGALRLARSLDYETRRVHRFTVKVLDGGSPRLPAAGDSSAAVTVEVSDVNDCPPAFSQSAYSSTVLLPTVAGATVLVLAASDPDAGSALTYDVMEGAEDGALALSPSGVLSVARAEALAPAARYRLRVRVSDGQHAAAARVDVLVRDLDNSGLAFQKADYYGSAVENSTRPTTIAVLNVLGAALNEHVHFHILNPDEHFVVGVTSGAVRTTPVPLDRERRDAYTLLVEARSGAAQGSARVARARLHVTVTDVNDNCPVFVEQPYVAAVLAGAPPGDPVLRVRALDLDANDNGEVRYEMKRGNGELFRVERRTGAVTLKQSLEAPDRLYTLVVAAFDGGSPACGAEAAVTVRVWRGGAGPLWERAHYALQTREDTPPGEALAPPLLARSPLARPLFYSLPRDDAGLFDVLFDTGVLVARAPLDYERLAEHELLVRATDSVTGAFADAAVTLRLLDVNDCAPEFDRDVYRSAVAEDAEPRHLVLTVRALDADAGPDGEVSYTLRAAEPDDEIPFEVEPATGAVRVRTPLDRELRDRYHLVAHAQDAGRPPLHATAHIFITVEDVNDNAPVVERAVIGAAVSEQATRGAALARVAAWDPDEDDATRLRYALVGATPRALALHPDTGVLTVTAPAALPLAPRSLNVSVSDGAHAAFARIKLTLSPANRAAPRFPHLVHEARALENQPPPLLLTTVKAYDEDEGEYGAVRYSIPSSALRDTFAVDAVSGALTTRVPLDRERRAEWTVPVLASDGGGLLRHTTVRVRVADLNDNAPVFPLREYRAAVRADAAPGAPLLPVTAIDADAGDNARLVYSVYESEATGLFAVDPVSGALSLAKDASSHAGRALRVWVRARDGGGLAAEAPVSVHVLAAGERVPQLRTPPADLFLREDAAPGALLAELRPEGEPGVRLRLAPAAGSDLFALDAAGRLVLAAPLDRETAPDHVIGIIAEGEGSPAPGGMVQTRLHVLDVNEHAPAFHSQPYVVHLAENAPPHASVVQLMADDPDAGTNGEVRYSLAEGQDDIGDLFAVEPHTGWVTTLAALDREARPEYRVAVVAADGGSPRRVTRGTLVVRLVDYNDCPPAFASSEVHASVREDAQPGTVVARLEVHDADATSAPLSFFVSGGDERARFQLRASGDLYVARALDRERQAAYALTVAAADGKFTAYATVRVTVLDVNDNPPYCVRGRYRVRLPEDAAPGTRLLRLDTEDADEPDNARLRYYLTGERAHHFAIDKETGEVTVADPSALDREAAPRYALRAHAQDRDRAPWACSADLLIDLDDVNDNAPRFTADTYSATLPEDADPGTVILKVHAADADLAENRVVRYSFAPPGAGDDAAEEAFALAEDTGVITLRGALDREARPEHRLVVVARDGGRPALSGTATVRLTVADVNDNPPEFEFRQYEVAVPELDAPGTQVLVVRATSRDAGVNADVRYSLVAGDDRDDFALDPRTGALALARPLDYERRPAYLLTVQALDGGTPPLSDRASISVTVVDANDNAPRCARPLYSAAVREDAPPGSPVLQVLADDADSGDNGRVRYSVQPGPFAVDPDTGHMTVAGALDRETTPTHVLLVRARDLGVPALEAACSVRVDVLDANDSPPLFAQAEYTVVVPEDRPLGHVILELRVEDADAPPNAAPFTFDFQAGNEQGAFRLDQDGRLRSAARFDHHIRDRYELRVRVFDNGTPPLYSDATVHVRVIERSRYPPAVTPLEVLVNSYLDEFPGGVIGRVHASDRDAYDTLAYALSPAQPDAGLFSIDADDGTLRAAPRLDLGAYRLNVTVGDGKFLSHATVRVTVALLTDETLAGAVVVRFREVTDRDFVLGHRKGFLRAVADATAAEPADVVIVSVQRSEQSPAADGPRRRRRQVAQDLDVAFAVRAPAYAGGYLLAERLRARLHEHLEMVEERSRLVVEELVRATCGSGCERGACAERLALRPGPALVVATEVYSLVAPAHRVEAECAVPAERQAPVLLPATVAVLTGESYLAYRVERGSVAGARLPDDELALSLRFRTRRERGTLLAVAGRVDHAALEVAEGYLQFRMELGSGPALVRAAVPVADGAWHEARLERRGAGMRLTVDRRSAQAQTPPPAAVLDASADRLLVGADLQRHEHAFAAEQVTYGFEGCISDLKLGGVALPLDEGGTSSDGRAQLMRAVRVRVASSCPALPPPSPCSSYPCLNGGTCRALDLLEGDGYACKCHARYSGRRCELDTDPCASQPCLHGGSCAPAPAPGSPGGPGYRCACADGLAGERCERGRWCGPAPCEHGGVCEEGEWGPSCRCRGYYGPRCQYDVDECAGEPCLNGATCLNEPGSFRCLCPPDKTGMNCGNPLHSDAVRGGGPYGDGGVGVGALGDAWRWACSARWPLAAAGAALALLLMAAACVPLAVRRVRRARRGRCDRRSRAEAEPLKAPTEKLSNLEAVRRERPSSCAERPPLNNVDTLRSYGSAGDELEGIPPDYRRNLNIDAPDRKPWSEQMHLQTFVDNKIYNDLKGRGAAGAGGPALRARARSPHLVGGYHWDCSDWCGGAGALPGITEVAGSERPDSSSPASPGSQATPCPSPPPCFQSDSAPEEYEPRDPDAASLITMLEERRSLLAEAGAAAGSCGSLSARLCEIEDSDAEEPVTPPLTRTLPLPLHTDV